MYEDPKLNLFVRSFTLTAVLRLRYVNGWHGHKSYFFNPIALRKVKIVFSFGLSECNRVKKNNLVPVFQHLTPKYHVRQSVSNVFFLLQPYSIVHGVLRVELIQVTQRGQFYVNQNLVEMGFADETEESALSKVKFMILLNSPVQNYWKNFCHSGSRV